MNPPSLLFPSDSHGSPRSFSGAGVRLCALTSYGHASAMANSPVAVNLYQALDILIYLTAKIAFNFEVFLDLIPELRYFVFCESSHSCIFADIGFYQNLMTAGPANSINIRECNLNTLISW